MIKGQTISLILPCKNEAQALKAACKSIPKGIIDELIVVDNGSSDETALVAKSFGAKVLTEANHVNGIGYGYALAKGIRQATSDIIVCMDGDGSYPASEIAKLVKKLQARKLDFISCSRLPFKNPQQMSLVRAFGVRVLNLILWALYGYKINDSLTGMWVFRRSACGNLSLFEGGWNFSLEIKLNAIISSKIRFAEAHIPYHDRRFDSSKQNLLRTGLEHLWYLFYFKLTSLLSKKLTITTRPSLLLEPSIN